jgi:hypothetical protein
MSKSELKKLLLEKGIESANLDDTVHDAASSLASSANNEGIDGQLEFLMEKCGWSSEDILKAI